jgi:hypothetical protein
MLAWLCDGSTFVRLEMKGCDSTTGLTLLGDDRRQQVFGSGLAETV